MQVFLLKSKMIGLLLATVISFIGLSSPLWAAETVNIYSARKEALIKPLLEKFKQQTGISYKLVTGKADGLLKRLEIEGDLSPADVFLTVDAGRLQRAKKSGVLQSISNQVLEQRIPEHLRDRDKYWFGLSQRARTLIYATDRVKPQEMTTYEALVEPQWKRRLCIRTSNNIYNQSLVASMIEAHGVEKTEQWARGLVANFARKPKGGDIDQIKAAAAGICDVALVNTYYFGRLKSSQKSSERALTDGLAIFWPNQGDNQRGVHVNVSGAGITRHARNLAAATKLLEFMVTDESQQWYSEVNNEYPVVPGVKISKTMESFGSFKSDGVNLTKLGENNRDAVKLMDRAGWK